jgi:hypothetical protein
MSLEEYLKPANDLANEIAASSTVDTRGLN